MSEESNQTSASLTAAGDIDRSEAERIDRLNALAWDLRNTEPDRSLTLAEEAKTLAEKKAYTKGLAESMRTMGLGYYRLAQFDLALSISKEALVLFVKLSDKTGESQTANTMGIVSRHLGDYASALDYQLRSLTHQQAIRDRQGEANSLANVGLVYADLGDYTNALEYQFKSLTIRQAIGDQQGEASLLGNIGLVYYNFGDYAKALEYHLKGLAIQQAIGDKKGEANSLVTIGLVYVGMMDYVNALEYHLKGLAIQQAIGDKKGEAGSMSSIGLVYANLGDYGYALDYQLKSLAIQQSVGDRYGEAYSLLALGALYSTQAFTAYSNGRALNYLHQALSLAQDLKAKDLIYESYFTLSKVYKQSGNYVKALENHEASLAIKEEVFSEQTNNKTKALQIRFEVEQSRKEAELQRKEAESFRLKTLELSMANAALKQANRLKTELLGIAAHDLKNPLQAIMGFAALIKEGSLTTPEEVIEFATLIESSSRRMFSTINDLLQTAAMDAGKLELQLADTDISTVVEAVAASNIYQAKAKAQRLTVSTQKGCIVKIDANRMAEVLDNIISNAVKYSPREKNIWITTRKDNGNVRIEVQDEGQGLTQKDLMLLFGRFQRLSAKPTGGESSTGLGLSIVKELVQQHGGKVWAESEGKDKGSRFIIELPAVITT